MEERHVLIDQFPQLVNQQYLHQDLQLIITDCPSRASAYLMPRETETKSSQKSS
jgi:hypothetical protein